MDKKQQFHIWYVAAAIGAVLLFQGWWTTYRTVEPLDYSEFLDHLKTYASDLPNVNGHDRVVKAFKDDLEAENPLPISIRCHSAAEEPEVTVANGRPVVFSLDTHVIVSIPTTPGREVRRQAAEAAKKRRVAKTRK